VAQRTLGQLDDAAARHNQALSLAQRVGDRIEVARALDGLGTVARLAGNVNDAHAFWTEALAIYTASASRKRLRCAPSSARWPAGRRVLIRSS